MRFALLITLGCCTTFAEAKVRPLDAAEAKQVEVTYEKAAGSGHVGKVQMDQTFAVDLNSGNLKDVIFAVLEDGGARFVVLSAGGRSVLQTLPKSDLAVVSMFDFRKVEAVAFRDLNGDGTKDILVLASYFDSRPVQGEGIGGETTKVGFAYLSQRDRFNLEDECGEDVASFAALEKCVKAKGRK